MNIIGIACDHAGYELKEYIKKELNTLSYSFKDFGTHNGESVDYPDFIHPLCADIGKNDLKVAIAICGSGNGVCMTANKYPYIRAALCWNKELAALARQHNDANVLCLPARFINKEIALEIAKEFLNTDFEGGRHQRRVEKINKLIL